MVEETIEQRGDGGGVAEELAPVLDGAIRSDQRGRSFVAAHDDLEEILGRGVRQPAHAEIVDEQERDGGDLREVGLRVPASWASASSSRRTWASR